MVPLHKATWARTLLASLYFLVVLSPEIRSQTPEETKAFSIPYSHFKLKNGLEVILSEDFALPMVSVAVAYNVGTIHDPPEKTGLAYLMENLMFQGSLNVGPMQQISFINRVGGESNAATMRNLTVFSQTVTSNQLALVFWLESDRMCSLDINPVNVERAKEAVVEEIRQRKAEEAYLESFLLFDEILFPDPAFSHPRTGYESDVRNLTFDDARNFYLTYYVPNNAAVCVVGNFNRARVKELVEKYFESIPRGKDVPPPPTSGPAEKGEVIRFIRDVLAPSPAFHLAYRIAPPASPDFAALTLLEYILMKGKTSRLPARLIRKEPVALHLRGGIDIRGNAAAFRFFVVASNDIMLDRSQKAIASEINKLKTAFISEEELTRVKNIYRTEVLHRFSSLPERAFFLGETYFSSGRLNGIPRDLEKHLRLTPSDIIGIINRYFIPDNSVIMNVKAR